jgi:hypothetical protein
VTTVTSPGDFSFNRMASSSANSSYGETMNFSPVSSTFAPETLMRDSVSGTWEMQTTEFKREPPKVWPGRAGAAFYEVRHANRKRLRGI